MKLPQIDFSKIEKKYLLAGIAVFIIMLFTFVNPQSIKNFFSPKKSSGNVSNDGNNKAVSPKVSKGPVTIIDPTEAPSNNKIIIAGWQEEFNMLDETIEYFKKRNPDYNVELKVFPATTYIDKLSSSIELKEEIDIFLIRNVNDYARFIERKSSLDIDDKIKSEKIDTSKFGKAFNALEIDDKLYGMPYIRNVYLTFFNKTLFQKYGVAIPPTNFTWADYKDVARKIMIKGKSDNVWGAYMDLSPQSWYISALQRGANLYDTDFVKFEEALNFRLNLELEEIIPNYKTQNENKMHYNTEFQKGNIAMHIAGDWHINQPLESPVTFDWDIGNIPYYRELGYSIGNYHVVCINKNSIRPEAAYEFLKYLISVDAGRKIVKKRLLPAYINDEIEKNYSEQFLKKPLNAIFAAKQDFVLEYPVDSNGYNTANTIFAEESAKIFSGITDVKDFGNEVTKRRKEVRK